MSEEMHLSIDRVRTKSLILFTLLGLLVSCANTTTSKTTYKDSSCITNRGAIDIGSGTSKLVVAAVNKCQKTIDHIIFEAQRAIPFKESLQRSKNNRFNKNIKSKALRNLSELILLAKSQGAKEIRAVATSAFRTAANADEMKNYLEHNLKFKIKIITQQDEALFAYNSAISSAKSKKLYTDKPVAVWDIGGGSMQIVTPGKDGKKTIYLGKLASVSFKNKVISKYYSKKFKKRNKSPNPLGKKTAVNSMNLAREHSNKTAKPMLGNLKDYQIFGVGGVHYYSIRGQLKDQVYDQRALLKTLLKRARLSDKQIASKYAATDVTNLALVLGFMQSLSIEKVTPLKINMAHGVLTTESLW
jgi:exopolyphosphatase/guanosine-5'-triphosphate,3'-diphosphate pyrophosphatase